MKKLALPLWFMLAGYVLASCGDIGPGPDVPECAPGTRPMVCHTPGLATCGEAESLDAVVGCYVQATPSVKLECVAACD